MHLLQEVADGCNANRGIFFPTQIILAHRVVKNWQRLVHNLVKLEVEGVILEDLTLTIDQIKDKIQGCRSVYAEIVELQNVTLQVDQHLLIEAPLEKRLDVLE